MPEFCFDIVAFKIRCALDEGRRLDAVRLAHEHLRAGYRSTQFLEIVLELMQAKKQPGEKTGPKPGRPPKHWFDIGRDYFDLYDAGYSYEQACTALAMKYGFGESTIKATVAFFRKAKAEHDDIQ
jgi:hypothetical protein